MLPQSRRPTLPGEILLEEFLRPMGMSQLELAARMGIPIQRLNGIVRGRRAITAETAVLLARELKTTSQFWLQLQIAVDLWDAEQRLGSKARRVSAAGRLAARVGRHRNK